MEFKKIIIRMPNWIGDLVMATPILECVRNNFKDVEITAMCQKPISQLLEKDPHIDELYAFEKQRFRFTRREEKRNIIEKLKVGQYDLGILLTNSFSSAWWFWQGHVKERVGFKGHFRSALLTKGIDFPESKMHQVDLYKEVVKQLDIECKASPRIYLDAKEVKLAKELLYQRGYVDGKRLVGINPGAAYGDAKRWPEERFKEVAKKLVEEDLFVVFFGDQNSMELVKRISYGLGKKVIDLAGVTGLRELASIIQECDVLLTNDSGPMHIADALGTEVVALFGSTDENKTGPYQGGKVVNKKVNCSPCFKRSCPIDFRCMKEIQVDEVVEYVQNSLKKNPS